MSRPRAAVAGQMVAAHVSGRENFPVGSALIRADLRPAVAAFYAFARGSDDVSDHPSLEPAAKLAGLDRFEAGLDGPGAGDGAPEGVALRAALLSRGRGGALRHARQLLDAFRRDARGEGVETWGDLLAYCEDSANPVGRFLLDLHGEGPRAVPASDALCTALQVLNHLQDIRSDFLALQGRCYLPGEWLRAEGCPDLSARVLSPGLRRVVDRALDRCDDLLDRATSLPGALASRRLGGEAAAILFLARALAARLRRGDPMAGRVALSRLDFARAGLRGALHALRPAGRGVPLRGRA